MISSRRPSLSQSPAPSQTASHLTNPRKRPSISQLQRLQTVFDASPYITMEERDSLAREIELDVRFITVWFQNRRQSDKRKAWTKRDRAKKKENACQQTDTTPLKHPLSLDQIASRLERVNQSTLPGKPRVMLSPHKPGSLVKTTTPTQPKEPKALWAHMPSSPLDAPSSPPANTLRLPTTPRLLKPSRSLDWACANARMGSKRRVREEDKRIREAKPRATSPCKHSAAFKSEKKGLYPSPSQGQDDGASPPAIEAWESRPFELGGKSTEDIEAAMVLLQFLRG
ncbi:hypothetical protein B0F90DRAFT_1680498 [Multifurca ochricompacta]|uniref:Homeobox domain-containing protein n=1 Tax=Multifurca ochricompacta TaxID=376703 RepID=A0AAD4ME22_9AGAM|nr:hypothetical protein B0F90DRAFT_1680498 [Multifurca ochricompacta]